MNDIWNNLGSSIAPSADAGWLYKRGGEVRGPVPLEAIVKKLSAGEIDLKTPVAREGGDFHPVAQVAAFASHLSEIKKHVRRRNTKKRLKLVALLLVLAAPVAGAALYFFQKEQQRLAEEQRATAQREAEAEQQRLTEVEAALKSGQPKLVALVSFDEQAMKVGGTAASAPKKPKSGGATASATKSEPEEMVQQCARGQSDIFKTLAAHLAKINVCVQDQKSRDADLPPTLTLEFIVLPSGKVSEFEIAHRAYRTGPMNNCMIKAFNTINFGSAGGSNCPVSIPIKIGG